MVAKLVYNSKSDTHRLYSGVGLSGFINKSLG